MILVDYNALKYSPKAMSLKVVAGNACFIPLQFINKRRSSDGNAHVANKEINS